MMGRQATKRELFVMISLDEYVPKDHLLRAVDRYLDLSEFRESLAESYSRTGRPSIDPELMARMLIIGYCYGIRSERRLCEEVGMNLAYRWFCRLGLRDKVPDHSSFSKNRHGRFRDHDAFRQLFDSVLRRCMAEGLVQGEGFATDASLIKADAQRQRSCSGDAGIDWGNPEQASRPVQEYLAALDQANPVVPKRISLTDPAATWTAAAGPAIFAYSTNYLIDLKAGIIVDVEASTVNKIAEVEATKTMIDRVEESSPSSHGVWLVTPTTALLQCWVGSSTKKISRHMFRYGINPSTMTGLSAVATSSMTPRIIATFALPENT